MMIVQLLADALLVAMLIARVSKLPRRKPFDRQ